MKANVFFDFRNAGNHMLYQRLLLNLLELLPSLKTVGESIVFPDSLAGPIVLPGQLHSLPET
jgi:hypothetical protein